MTTDKLDAPVAPRVNWTSRIDLPVATAFGCIILLLLIGSLYSPNFQSPEYLLQ